MKRGKDDDKVMGPMFPRLHVNDTEKGGPRAPPRNKMALYEQLSIPSQRFKSAAMPINANTTVNPAGSTSQGSGHQSNTIYSHPVTPPRQAAEKSASYYYDSSASFLPPEWKKHLEEDDFMVPIFTHPRVGLDRGDCFLSGSANTECSTKHHSNSDNEPKHILPVGQNTGQEVGNQNGERLRDFDGGREHSVKAVSKSSSVDKAEVALMQAGTSLCHSPADNTANRGSRLVKAGHMLPEHRGQSRFNGGVLGDAILDVSTRVTSSGNAGPVYDFHPEDQQILDDSDSRGEKTCQSLPGGVADRDDDASETSMVDSVSAFELSPDDVVGIIGQKHFWKARRAIINQQRVFAVQVFELHRLIKVQRLIAGSPRLLLEDSMYLGKSRKGSSAKKLPVDCVAKGISNGSKLKIDSEKPSHKFECSAENTVGKASLSSVHNGSQLPSYKPLPTNSAAAAAATGDHATGSWCYHRPQGHQWLIPVMSPSEGLVYKPYLGPGFMASSCEGCGPPGLTPMMGSFFPPAYGIPSTHHYQGMGVPPFANPAGPQGYFPPHGMAVLNEGITGSVVDSRTHFGASRLHGQPPQFMANHDIQHQNSSNMPSQKNGATADVMTSHASRDDELQMSTASSPSEQVQRSGIGNMTEGSGVLPLFPTSPVVEAPILTAPQEVDHPALVIKVVPHNGRSVTESVARIFQSIQEERKQYVSA